MLENKDKENDYYLIPDELEEEFTGGELPKEDDEEADA